MIKYEIKDNPCTGGLYAFFEYDGRRYYADLSPIPFSHLLGYKNECMIFTEIDGKVDYGQELYCKRNIPVSKEALTACIDEFNTNYKNEN